MERLRRKVDKILENWKKTDNRYPLIIKGARQIGKTEAIEHFAKNHYKSIIEINFVLQKQYKTIFDDGFDVDTIIRNISLINPEFQFIENETLFFFDEIQDCINCATSLKSFQIDGRYDVICSGSLMGINYQEIESNSVGYKQDYEMYSLDFEEYLWAKGYKDEQIESFYKKMLNIQPLSTLEYNILLDNFREYMVLGGMPKVVFTFVTQKNYSGTLQLQKQLLLDYEEDITKYAGGLNKGRILDIYRKIPIFLGSDNKKFKISKIKKNARNRDYVGVVDWLSNAGIVNVCYCMGLPELPLKGNYNPDNYKLYFGDTGLLIGSLDEEVQEDLRYNKNFNTYKGAIYENIISEILVKQGYKLYFYKNEKSTIEMDFMIRDRNSLIPVEVKANDQATTSLNKLIKDQKYSDIHYGIKFANKNIGFNDYFYTFPYFLAFFLKRFLRDKNNIK
ncbi:MAG TPA: ATP-binding protein [Candidatus Erysipelatoclostridium merdavium]|uniref:ATP-binding protein n=1 Tax=Candidatus Erysipelatoclostridium merdavium TaxID=2838566 RepID=A0A9D1XNT6_9FIRM|nr:ATP-binding protein [Thomasclavelia sp.]HIX82862.1 ATP-binding protein [Candidatus Erysipelatoclostridium merdavium]